jgi:hypothetical protein
MSYSLELESAKEPVLFIISNWDLRLQRQGN